MITMKLAFAGIGGMELIFIFAVILLLFGAKKIPELAKGLGRGIREFKDATAGIKDEIETGINEDRPRPKATLPKEDESRVG